MQQDTRRAVRRVLIITLALNLIVAISKIALGIVTGAVSITADGFHSLMDGSSNVVGLGANIIAARPPDDTHPYGHRRFETIAALGVGVLLLITAFEIVSSAFENLSSGERPEITPLTFVVLIGTLAVNVFITTYERRQGEKLRSELLIADAAHTGADVFVTVSVIVSMALIALFGWTWADPVAALVIVVLIARAAWGVLKQTGGVLVDTAPYPPSQLAAYAEDVPSVQRVIRARSRGPADAVHIDIDVQVAAEMTAEQTAAIADAIREKLEQNFDGINEVEVHFEPEQDGAPDYALTARARAAALGMTTHEVRVVDGTNGRTLEMHVEVPPGQTLGEAHEQVSQLEHDILASLPEVLDVVTHIEPSPPPAHGDLPKVGESARLAERAMTLLQLHYPAVGWHDLRVSMEDDGYALTLHAALAADTSLDAAHGVASDAETVLRSDLPEISRVTIHTEPYGT